MEKVTDSYGASMFSDVNHDCVFSVAFDLTQEYSIYYLNYDSYLHHVFQNGSTAWYISHEPDSKLVEQVLRENGIETDSDTVVTVDKLDLIP